MFCRSDYLSVIRQIILVADLCYTNHNNHRQTCPFMLISEGNSHFKLKYRYKMNKLIYGLFLTLFFSFSSAYAEVSAESVLQILQRLENLEKKTRELHGENEVLNHEIQRLKKIQKQGFLAIDERIDEVRKSLKAQPTPPKKALSATKTPDVKIVERPADKQPPVTKPKVPAKPNPPETNNNAGNDNKKPRAPTAYEKEVYQSAFVLMKKSPTAATKAFREYIKLQPKSPLAANAQYWIGEIMYSHNNYKGAVQEFIKVLQNYKYSDKAPDAAIKLGYSFYALKNWKLARRTFEDVLRYFPENKNAVMLAKKRLETMKAAGN